MGFVLSDAVCLGLLALTQATTYWNYYFMPCGMEIMPGFAPAYTAPLAGS